MEPYISQPKLQKVKKIHAEKITYTSGNRNCKKISNSFSKKAVLIFQESRTLKIQETEFYIPKQHFNQEVCF